jgi:hypothetical protein
MALLFLARAEVDAAHGGEQLYGTGYLIEGVGADVVFDSVPIDKPASVGDGVKELHHPLLPTIKLGDLRWVPLSGFRGV